MFKSGYINQEDCTFFENNGETKYMGPIFFGQKQGNGVIYKAIDNPTMKSDPRCNDFCDEEKRFKVFEGNFVENLQFNGKGYLYQIQNKNEFLVKKFTVENGNFF